MSSDSIIKSPRSTIAPSEFTSSFQYLDIWKKRVEDRAVKLQFDEDCSVKNKLCLEEELQVRLDRMTAIAEALKFLCLEERQNLTALYEDSRICEGEVTNVLLNMIKQFNDEMQNRKQRLGLVIRNMKRLEKEKTHLNIVCKKVLTGAVEDGMEMQRQMTKSENKLEELHQDMTSIRQNVNYVKNRKYTIEDLKSEVALLKEKINILENGNGQNNYLSKENSDIASVLHRLENLEHQYCKMRTSEFTPELYQKPRGKLNIFKRKLYSSKKSLSTDSDVISDNISERSLDSCVSSSRKKLSNNENVMEACGAQSPNKFVSGRYDQDICLDVHSVSKQSIKEISTSEELQFSENIPLRNESLKTYNLFNMLTRSASSNLLSDASLDKIDLKKSKSGMDLNNECTIATDNTYSMFPNRLSIMEKPIALPISENTNSKTRNRKSAEGESNEASCEVVNTKKMKKVKRQISFGGFSKSSGLVSFAKDLERRMKNRRRSQTVTLVEPIEEMFGNEETS